MIQHEAEKENIGHSNVRVLPTGCITMLGWRQLSHTPDQAAVNVTQGIYITKRYWNHAVLVLRNIQQTHRRIVFFSHTPSEGKFTEVLSVTMLFHRWGNWSTSRVVRLLALGYKGSKERSQALHPCVITSRREPGRQLLAMREAWCGEI